MVSPLKRARRNHLKGTGFRAGLDHDASYTKFRFFRIQNSENWKRNSYLASESTLRPTVAFLHLSPKKSVTILYDADSFRAKQSGGINRWDADNVKGGALAARKGA